MSAHSRALLAAALQLLSERGFRQIRYAPGGARIFRGPLQLSTVPLTVNLLIWDWDFLEYPCVRVMASDTARFPELRPHLNEDGDVCYFSRRSVVLDRYDPATAIAQCLDQATAVLDKILNDHHYLATDVQNELLVHWERQRPQAVSAWLGSVKHGAIQAPLHFATNDGGVILADDYKAAATIASALHLGSIKATSNRCWLFHVSTLPPVPPHFPQNVRELFDWLREWDHRLYKAVQRLLGTDDAYAFVYLGLAVHTPVGWIGLLFNPNLGGKAPASKMKAVLHERGEMIRVERLAFTDVSPEFVHTRNLLFRDLSGLTITLVGCGAIGSQLAAALIRLGAGQGSNGILRLVDEEDLKAENLGRHYLGYDRLGQNKASALRSELLAQFPLSRTEAVPYSAQHDRMLFRGDLLIDATGDEPVSEYLNAQWLEQSRPCPVLYCWIKGNGECVQALFVDGPQDACFRCLRESSQDVYRQERFPVLKQPPMRKVLGCHAFTPYAVTAPLQAAALAADILCDWAKGDVSPRYRTRARENVDIHPTANLDPQPLADCPACTLL
ncbi:MAG: ThiF family adenylyltransferase [Acidovorax sp.]|uniref:ThiF family adenylyltransferase n=1 Tax=Acidovorax sp. TaxID=1872122 RepID=UPI0022BF1497|nr:ThiF family adenylyltransferase [Acidovorax sp.]MCZ8218875.1 ThiF family adenylyltransferase [Acidovorax sp.]